MNLETVGIVLYKYRKQRCYVRLSFFAHAKSRYTHDPVQIRKIYQIIMKRLDPSRARKIFIRKKLGHTAVSAIKASSVTL